MSKETLQHTMRSKVRVFEDGGIRLLRKGQKGLIHAIFSRFGLVLVLLVLQFGALFSLMRWFSNLLPHYLGGTLLVTAASWRRTKRRARRWTRTAPARPLWRSICADGAAASRCTKTRR